ncbi:uncharacterized protein LOC112589928 [Harpegnathos saltator]|uniref:uncharacterized protein LOC112589928 n=1 Tax=Harpegnathos saltator TaxID=610380 RepID=UPI000DBEEF32|nr:uncharacterized protein LOC112589928 [Harpegnathos saltator]
MFEEKPFVKTTTAQYEELVKYMESHSEFATNKYLTKDCKIHHAKQWEQLAEMLNALPAGNKKTLKQWQTVWRDLKSNASKKAAKLRYERNRTGNFPLNSESLDNLQQRIVACMGLQYVEGAHDCPDSTPEQEKHQLQLGHGNDDVLNIPLETTSISEIWNMEKNADIDNVFEIMETNTSNGNDLTYNDVMQCLNNEDTTTKRPTGLKRGNIKETATKKEGNI